MHRAIGALGSVAFLLAACRGPEARQNDTPPESYFGNGSHADAWSGGARKITISTPKGAHQVWIKRVGNNPIRFPPIADISRLGPFPLILPPFKGFESRSLSVT
jgi:hypothetical protein